MKDLGLKTLDLRSYQSLKSFFSPLMSFVLSLKSNLGFTLIELLVVISIIGLLAGILVPNFMAARERGRDAQRKSDLRQIQKAIELYRQDQADSSYPAPGVGGTFPNTGSVWQTASTVYMSKVPGDPKTTTPVSYYYTTPTAQTYTLVACLENKADPDGVANCPAGIALLSTWCTVGGGNPNKCYTVTQP